MKIKRPLNSKSLMTLMTHDLHDILREKKNETLMGFGFFL